MTTMHALTRRLAPALFAMVSSACLSPAFAQSSAQQWTGTWSVAPSYTTDSGFDNQTIRQIVHTSIGGRAARVRFSNLFGTEPLVLGNVHIAKRSSGAQTVAQTDRAVTFNGQSYVTIPVGGSVVSDTVAFPVPVMGDVAVSVHVPSKTPPYSTGHPAGLQDVYVAPGDASGDASFKGGVTNPGGAQSYYFLTNLDVVNEGATGAVVTFGASITDGLASTPNTNRRWPNRLAARLAGAGLNVGVLDQGISGNSFFIDTGPSGQAGLTRFNRDVLQQANVKWVVISDDAVNDLIGGDPPTAQRLKSTFGQLIAQAHSAKVKVICSTLTPFEGVGTWTPAIEDTRQAMNAWLRSGASGCDGVLDQAAVLGDPGSASAASAASARASASTYAPAYNSGDNLHPNDAGLQAIANAVDLDWFAALPTVRAPSACGHLAPGEGLSTGQTLKSCDGRVALTLGTNGYLVVVRNGTTIWSSQASGTPGVRVRMQENGMLILFDANGEKVWETATPNHPWSYAYMQNDGRLVIYSVSGAALWSSTG
ncbi:GDSL-type esterase/lipase family protein [Caballeronia sp. Lep1P3]|uniref:GDSL-type esterase/lipase family protein n=1 Tax=Caballeronia sp. Lep1P3 TaxID=2878150 RepID=UPI001FD4669D|nr:GDSL-type esterase/lipase family protein [Caballeronia sp. Lep1P3]